MITIPLARRCAGAGSTYGDRLHEHRATRQSRLEALLDKAVADHGTVLIPAFSVGHTQELLYEIEDILHRKSLSSMIERDNAVYGSLPVILDSPLASRMTRVYREFDYIWIWDAQAGPVAEWSRSAAI